MRREPATVALLAGLVAMALATAGCEYIVRLDRGLVDAGGDAACAICSEDAGEDDGGDGGELDASMADASRDATGE
jgi:hypothetical protein